MAQKTNDQIILEQIIKERCAESGDELTVSEYFEIYSASEILKIMILLMTIYHTG